MAKSARARFVAELEAFVREAHEQICPYSHATRGNVAVNFTVVGA